MERTRKNMKQNSANPALRKAIYVGISQDVAELFPEARIYTDREVSQIIYKGALRSFQKWLDRQPINVCYRGPRNQRLLKRAHITRAMERMELCERPKEDPANSNSRSARIAPIGMSRGRLTDDAITKARNALSAGKQRSNA